MPGLVAWPLDNLMLSTHGAFWAILVAHTVMFALLAVPLGSGPALFVEMFPKRDRLSGYSVAFNLGLGVFGGLTPMIATSLIAMTGAPTSAAVYMTIAALTSVAALSFVPDRSRSPLR